MSDDIAPPRPDLERRRRQLGEAQTARRSAFDIFAEDIANVIADATGATVEQRLSYKLRMITSADRLADSESRVEEVLLDTITLMIMYQSLQLESLKTDLIREIRDIRDVRAVGA